jgi:D-alanyl-D-alanine carboxypeptidase
MRHVVCTLLAMSLSACATHTPPVTPAPPVPTPPATRAAPAEPSGLEALRARFGVPALAGAVLDSERTLWIEAVGKRRADADEAVTVNDHWHLGSNGKAISATLAARLVAKQQLHWESSLAGMLGAADVDASHWSVTLADLVVHRGGISPNIATDHAEVWQQLWADARDPAALQHFARSLLAIPADVQRGQYAYSNAGYVVLGAALEKVSERSFHDLLREEVFAPLQMAECGFGAPEGEAPWGHAGSEHAPVPPGPKADNPWGMAPAGTMHCSLASWAAFVRAHLRAARGLPSSYLSAGDWQRLQTPVGEYAAGWIVVERPWAGGKALTHAGSNTLWYARVWIAPGIDRAFLTVANAGSEAAAQATDAAIGYLLEHPAAAPG